MQSALVVLDSVEDFEGLSEKKKEKIKERIQKYAKNVFQHANTIDSLMTPGDGRIEITFVNGKKIFICASGGEAAELMTEDAYVIQSMI